SAVEALTLDASDFRRVVQRAPEVAERVTRRLELMSVDAALKRASPFAGLPPDAIWSLAEQLENRVTASGEGIVRQGDPGDCFYLVRTGSVAVIRDGRRIAKLGAGDSFGEVALLASTPRTATVRALEQTSLLVLTRDAFQRVAQEQATVANYF